MSGDIRVAGVGFWSRGFATADALACGRRDDSVTKPEPTLGNRRHLRYTSDVTKMSLVACEQALAGTDVPLDNVNVVFGSSQGEIQIAVELLDMIAKEGTPSPARFMNSVHNTVCGHISIAAKSHGAFAAVAGAEQTVSGAVTEAFTLLAGHEFDNVVIVCADERLPTPVDLIEYEAVAGAIFLRRSEAASGPRFARIVRDVSVAPHRAPEHLANNPCVPVLGVLAAIQERKSGLVRLDGDGGEGWCVELAP